MFSFLKYAVLAAFMASSATAATIHDESVSGDAGVGLSAVDLGVLGGGVNTILFDNLGADQNGLDQDEFTFTLLQEATLDVDTSQGPVIAFLDGVNIFGGCCGFTTNITEPDPLAPATYTLRFETDTSFGQGLAFSSNINVADASAVVPLPATALLLLSSLVGLGVFRARKSA